MKYVKDRPKPLEYVKYVWSPEDWSPCFAGHRVEVRLTERYYNGKLGGWTIGVSGADDRGASGHFNNYADARRLYLAISDGITLAECGELGLTNW